MLKMLRDEVEHKVYTAVCVLAPRADARSPGYRIESWVEETTVKFAAGTSDEMVLAYVRTREGVDKAGGYGIQGVGSVLVEGVTGSWDNVVGLPVRVTLGLIEKLMKRNEEGSDVESGAEEEEEEV
jgi:septum formation protein